LLIIKLWPADCLHHELIIVLQSGPKIKLLPNRQKNRIKPA